VRTECQLNTLKLNRKKQEHHSAEDTQTHDQHVQFNLRPVGYGPRAEGGGRVLTKDTTEQNNKKKRHLAGLPGVVGQRGKSETISPALNHLNPN